MAARNRCFRIAALLTAASYLMLAVRYLIEAGHLFGSDIPTGYGIASVIDVVARLVGAAGWAVVATAFRPEIDWRRLRAGAAIVSLAYIATFAATVFDAAPTLAHQQGDIRGYYVWGAIGALLLAVAALIVISGFVDSKRGAPRASRLQLGFALAVASAAAVTVAALALQSFYSAQGYVHELTIGALVTAVGEFGVMLATLVFTLGAKWELPRREARLAAAAIVAAAATLGVVAGEALVAFGFASHGAPSWQEFPIWLGVAYSVVAIGIFGVIARGARSAVA